MRADASGRFTRASHPREGHAAHDLDIRLQEDAFVVGEALFVPRNGSRDARCTLDSTRCGAVERALGALRAHGRA